MVLAAASAMKNPGGRPIFTESRPPSATSSNASDFTPSC